MPRNIVKGETLADRFWRQVDKSGDCWLWTGSRLKDGYGRFSYEWRTRKAHRASWEVNFGPIPHGMAICHRCDVRLCVRPDHLFLGTSADNNADMVRKGRQASGATHWTRVRPANVRRGPMPPEAVRRGEQASGAKLTEADVRSIRAAHVPRQVSYPMLAARYGVTPEAIKLIVRRKTWSHVE